MVGWPRTGGASLAEARGRDPAAYTCASRCRVRATAFGRSHTRRRIASTSSHGRLLQKSSPRLPSPAQARQDRGHSDQGTGHAARPRARLLAGRGGGMRRDRRRAGARERLHRARQPDRRDHQRDRRAGPGRDRAARRQAGDGRQGRAVQEVRRHRRVRHRDRRARSRQAGGDHRQPGAHLRRHQPGGHQGARVLPHRAQAARADADPGVPRRPARHRHHRRCRRAQRTESGRQGHRAGEAGLLRRRRRGAVLPGPAGPPRARAGEHPGHRHQGRGVQGPQGGDGSVQGALRQGHRRPHAGRGDRRRRHLSRPVGAAGAQAGDGQADGGPAAHPRARQPDPGDHAGGGEGGAARLHHRHRPFRLSQPGQQRPVLSLHLPRRAGCGRNPHHRGDEARRHARHRRAGAPGAVGCRGRGLRGGQPVVRPGVPHPQALRPAPDRQDRAGSGQGGGGQRCGHAPARRPRGLPPAAHPVRLPLRADHAAGVRCGQAQSQAGGLLRGRGPARAARGAGCRGRGARAPDRDRASGGGECAHRQSGPARAGRQGLRAGQSRQRPALPRTTGSSTTT